MLPEPLVRVASADDPVASLVAALAERGLPCGVDARGTAAVLAPTDDVTLARFADEATRRAVMTVGRALGFTHVAVLIGDG